MDPWKLGLYLNILLLCLFSYVSSEPKKKKNRKREDVEGAAEVAAPPVEQWGNVCDLQEPDVIYCYCDVTEYGEAEEGNCWIFNDTKQHPHMWESFTSQSRMKKLTLHLRPDGTLSVIPTAAIMHLPELHLFEVQYATMTSVQAFSFGNSSTVEEILLSRNSIEVLHKNAFAHLPSLRVLSLGENHITEINRRVFVDLGSIEQLYIDRNNITTIHDRAFQNLASLKELELFSNHIQVITPETFKGLKSLTRLDLKKNRIEVIGDMTFQDLTSLTVLNLHENSLKYLAPKAFFGLGSLKKLALQDNKLLSLGSDVFVHTKNLHHIDVRHNVLETLTHEAVRPLMRNLASEGMQFFPEGNNFRCDKRLLWMLNLYNNTKSKSVRHHLDSVLCYLESGTLPARLANLETVTPPYETTTLGIGPVTRLMALLPEELLEMRPKWGPSEDPDCEEGEEDPKQKQKKRIKGRRTGGSGVEGKSKGASKDAPPTSEPSASKAQNDMALDVTGRSVGVASSTKDDVAPGAEPVHESKYSGSSGICCAGVLAPLVLVALWMH